MTDYLLDILTASWHTFAAMSPYLLFGFLVAGLLSVMISPATVERHLGREGIWSVIKAAVLGVPLPLCSCGVIPIAASLRRHGASRGATASFLISTPQTGVDSIMATLVMLGPLFAVIRPFAAFISGVVGGIAVESVGRRSPAAGGAAPAEGAFSEAGCELPSSGNALYRAMRYGFLSLPASIGRGLIIGILIAGMISALIPEDFFAAALGTGFLSMLVMMAVGIPTYVCATASVPIAAAMIAKGISPGAALVFLMTGPATNGATIGVLWNSLGRASALVYLAVVGASSLAAGILMNTLLPQGLLTEAAMAHQETGIAWWEAGSAIALAIVLALALRPAPKHAPQTAGSTQVDLIVSGMTCNHCAESVRSALLGCTGVIWVGVDQKKGTVSLRGTDLDNDSLVRAVAAAGFTATIEASTPASDSTNGAETIKDGGE